MPATKTVTIELDENEQQLLLEYRRSQPDLPNTRKAFKRLLHAALQQKVVDEDDGEF